jgi:F0F1-type ATP synthase assembly protein I
VSKKDDPLPDYERPELPFERKAEPGHGGLVTAGLEFAAIVGLFLLGGNFLDGKLGTDPWLKVVGALVGMVLGMIRLVRRVTRSEGPDGR